MNTTEYQSPLDKLLYTVTQLEKDYVETLLIYPKIFNRNFNPRNKNSLVSICTSITIDNKQIQPLDLLYLSCLINVLKKTWGDREYRPFYQYLIDITKVIFGYQKLDVFCQSIEGFEFLKELYLEHQEKNCALDNQKKIRKFFIQLLEALYEYGKETVKSYDIQQDNIEAKLTLFIANALKIKDISKLLTEKEITTEGLDSEFLEALKKSEYDIAKALISSINRNINIPITDRLFELSNQKTLSLELIRYIKLGNLKLTEQFLTHGVDPNIQDKLGRTTLHFAAKNGYLIDIHDELLKNEEFRENLIGSHLENYYLKNDYLKILEALFNNGANPNIQDKLGRTAIHFAAEDGGCCIFLEKSFANGANPNIRDRLGKTPLHLAVEYQHLTIILKLLDNGANPNIRDRLGNTPLHFAARNGCFDTVAALLDKNANPNIKNNDGKTPLELVISIKNLQKENLKIAEALIDKGAAELTDDDVHHLVWIAFLESFGSIGDRKILNQIVEKLLTKKNINPSIKHNGIILLHYIAWVRNLEMLEVFLAIKDIDINIQDDKTKQTALHKAILKISFSQKEDLEIVQLLLKHGADPKIQDKDGYTPLHIAVRNGYVGIVKILLTHKDTNPNTKANDGNTPLHMAILKNVDQEIVEALIAHRADPTITNNDGNTPEQLKKVLESTAQPITNSDQSKNKHNNRNTEIFSFTIVTLIACIITEWVLATKTNKFPIDFSEWIDPEIIGINIIAILLPFSVLAIGIASALSGPSTKVVISEVSQPGQTPVYGN